MPNYGMQPLVGGSVFRLSPHLPPAAAAAQHCVQPTRFASLRARLTLSFDRQHQEVSVTKDELLERIENRRTDLVWDYVTEGHAARLVMACGSCGGVPN